MEKTLHNSDVAEAAKNVPDIKIVGNGDLFRLICKASSQSEGWMKSTKAMEVFSCGCVVQVTTQQRNPDGSYSIAEALTFVPDAVIVKVGDAYTVVHREETKRVKVGGKVVRAMRTDGTKYE